MATGFSDISVIEPTLTDRRRSIKAVVANQVPDEEMNNFMRQYEDKVKFEPGQAGLEVICGLSCG